MGLDVNDGPPQSPPAISGSGPASKTQRQQSASALAVVMGKDLSSNEMLLIRHIAEGRFDTFNAKQQEKALELTEKFGRLVQKYAALNNVLNEKGEYSQPYLDRRGKLEANQQQYSEVSATVLKDLAGRATLVDKVSRLIELGEEASAALSEKFRNPERKRVAKSDEDLSVTAYSQKDFHFSHVTKTNLSLGASLRGGGTP